MELFSFIRKFAYSLVLSYTLQQIPKVLKAFEDFLNSSTEQDFEKIKTGSDEPEPGDPGVLETKEDFLKVPLYLSSSGLTKLKEKLAEFPKVFDAGTRKDDPENFLYFLGQFLINVASRLDYIKLSKKYPEQDKDIDDFYKLWGLIYETMNAIGLYKKYKNKSDSAAKEDLIKKLNGSVEIVEKLKDVKI